MVFVRATAYRAGLLSRKQEFVRIRLLYLQNGMVLRPKIHVAVRASVGMVFPSNVYVGPKARPCEGFLAQMSWKFDPQPLWQSDHRSDAGPRHAKVPASFKQYAFEEISLFRFNSIDAAVHHRGRSSVLSRSYPAVKISFETTPDLASARRSARVLLRNRSLQSNARQIAGARSCMVQSSRPR